MPYKEFLMGLLNLVTKDSFYIKRMHTVVDWQGSVPIIVMGDHFYLSFSRSRYIHEEDRTEEGNFVHMLKYPLVPMTGVVLKEVDGEFKMVEENHSESMLNDLVYSEEYVKFMNYCEYYNIRL